MFRDGPESSVCMFPLFHMAGVTLGLAAWQTRGEIVLVEVSVMPGRGNLVLTGQLGDVMKESARAGLTYAQTHYDELGIAKEQFASADFHVHVPAGAVPKEGPSAGITMATAIVSALSGRRWRTTWR